MRCTLRDHLRNNGINEDIKIPSVIDRIKEYREYWNSHVERMVDTRFPKKTLKYIPAGKKDHGSPWKQWSVNCMKSKRAIAQSLSLIHI